MNTIDRIQKLIKEYKQKISDVDAALVEEHKAKKIWRGNGWDTSPIFENLAKLNAQRQAYTTIIADLESIANLAPTV